MKDPRVPKVHVVLEYDSKVYYVTEMCECSVHDQISEEFDKHFAKGVSRNKIAEWEMMYAVFQHCDLSRTPILS
eukprot:UN11172